MEHTFTQSGLGRAPFAAITPPIGEASNNFAGIFYCEHCGRTIKNRHFVASACGKTSIVGSSCVEKTGDTGLIAGFKRIARELAAKEREARIIKANQEREQNERTQFGGKTKTELWDECHAKVQAAQASFKESLCSSPIGQALSQSSFGMAMIEIDRSYTPNMLASITSVLASKASQGARKNSKAYKDALAAAQVQAEALQAAKIQLHEQIKEICKPYSVCASVYF